MASGKSKSTLTYFSPDSEYEYLVRVLYFELTVFEICAATGLLTILAAGDAATAEGEGDDLLIT